ncbi:MAG: cytochrome C, partial [Mesorhizobium sp.]
MMHISWKKLAIALAILPFVVVLAAWIGFFNVGASSGHWKITEWFLHFAMRSAVRTYALAVDVPET